MTSVMRPRLKRHKDAKSFHTSTCLSDFTVVDNLTVPCNFCKVFISVWFENSRSSSGLDIDLSLHRTPINTLK